jgi:protein phosphatase
MCSDGLTDLLRDYEIETILRDSETDLSSIAKKLVAEANRLGGNDNITVALVQVDIASEI